MDSSFSVRNVTMFITPVRAVQKNMDSHCRHRRGLVSRRSQSPGEWLPRTGGGAWDPARAGGLQGWNRDQAELGLQNTAHVQNATESFILKWLILCRVNFISIPYFVKNSKKTHIKSQDFLTTTTVRVFLIIIMLPCTIYLPFSQVGGK